MCFFICLLDDLGLRGLNAAFMENRLSDSVRSLAGTSRSGSLTSLPYPPSATCLSAMGEGASMNPYGESSAINDPAFEATSNGSLPSLINEILVSIKALSVDYKAQAKSISTLMSTFSFITSNGAKSVIVGTIAASVVKKRPRRSYF